MTDTPAEELDDIESDPEESENVAEGNENVVADLEGKLDDWLDSFEHAVHTGEVSMRMKQNNDSKTSASGLP